MNGQGSTVAGGSQNQAIKPQAETSDAVSSSSGSATSRCIWQVWRTGIGLCVFILATLAVVMLLAYFLGNPDSNHGYDGLFAMILAMVLAVAAVGAATILTIACLIQAWISR